ncbi:Protein cereblon [Linum grandiflorum]
MDNDAILEMERQQMEQIRELDFEELQVEEVGDDSSDDGADPDVTVSSEGFTFDLGLASLHSYLGEVDDTHNRLAFLNGGAIITLPLFYLEGVVLFPESTLPLRVVQRSFTIAIERALTQVDAAYTIGVVRAHRSRDNRRLKLANIGTTAEIRQYRRLDDGTFNVVTRGQQRFRLKRLWLDVDGVPCAEVQIIEEDSPLRAPKEALGKLMPLSKLHSSRASYFPARPLLLARRDGGSDSDASSDGSFESDLSLAEKKKHITAVGSYGDHDMIDDQSTSSDDDEFVFDPEMGHRISHVTDLDSTLSVDSDEGKWFKKHTMEDQAAATSSKQIDKQAEKVNFKPNLSHLRKSSAAFWPYWVYQMYDSYELAQRVADMWKKIVGSPSMDDMVKKPDLLSFYIASKMPVSEPTRQELLEIDGVSYRLRREIELLERFDLIRCKICKTVIARRSEMLVMSSDGPLGAYVNPHGFVHEVMTLYKANGLALMGRAVAEYSWFPGYAWTIANCATCETQIGWRFTATKKKLKPRSFWGIRSAQVADDDDDEDTRQ